MKIVLRSLLTPLTLIIMLVSLPLCAAEVKDLYSAQTDASLNDSKRNQTALATVLVKVTGKEQILEHPAVRSAMRRASDLLLSFRFDVRDGQRVYLATFDQSKVDALINTADFPLWSSIRPHTLVWLAVEDEQGERVVINEDSPQTLKSVLLTEVSQRGLDVSLPLMDLTDLAVVSLYDIWGRFSLPVLEASQRYQPDMVVLARLHKATPEAPMETAEQNADALGTDTMPGWQLEWQNLTMGQLTREQISGDNPQLLIRQFVAAMATQQAQRYAVSLSQDQTELQTVQLKITNVFDLLGYENARRYLAGLTSVAEIRTAEVNGNVVTFSLRLYSSAQELRRTLALDDKLKTARDEFGMPVSELEFSWEP
ncbi:DUF2066 domain-containing protein [Bowmanella sp. JS7-9]|uniref:DUF2066 domain-containing protein n=1 Tax=Pseudobowmanella zhangzhouensis TaxID=1537679 RepID=A0ABW1XJR4_9ALTE|nr:DUF2066 domain-containing protein [Bowmanella sp. JS7-9]TBX23112.1 hypothetical protein TK45_07795 [Bowmanella sp. JS7-9]